MTKSYRYNLFIIGLLFFIFGFITWINSILIPFLKRICELNESQAYFVTFAFYIAYFVMAIPSSFILKKTGFPKGMALGLMVMAAGALCFIPAAVQKNYLLFLIGLFVQGTGLALLQTAANPFVTILGPMESAAKRISIMGISNKMAGMIGVFLLSKLLSDLSSSIILPYIIVAAILTGLAVMILFSKLPEIEPEKLPEASSSKSIWDFPHLWLGVLAIFVYVGAEVIAIDTLVLYGKSWGIDYNIASKFPIYSLVALTAGYLIGIVTMPKLISQRHALIVQTLSAIGLSLVVIFGTVKISIIALILLSFTHAIMWPAIWPLSLEGLGKHTKLASAFLIMAIAGGAVLPLIYGRLAQSYTNQSAYFLLIPLYIIILFFACSGYRIGKKTE